MSLLFVMLRPGPAHLKPVAILGRVAIVKWFTVALCVVQGGYMLLDGSKALITGSYITPSSGDHAGQLGPWAQLVSGIGVSPSAVGMKLLFITLGTAWIVTAVGIGAQAPWAWPASLIVAIATLWYLIPGTIISALVLIFLLATPLRTALARS